VQEQVYRLKHLKDQYSRIKAKLEGEYETPISDALLEFDKTCNELRGHFSCLENLDGFLVKSSETIRLKMKEKLRTCLMRFDREMFVNLLRGYSSMKWMKEYDEDFGWASRQAVGISCGMAAKSHAEQYMRLAKVDNPIEEKWVIM
jgi:hypothetical protein